jgi:hypothetical protein
MNRDSQALAIGLRLYAEAKRANKTSEAPVGEAALLKHLKSKLVGFEFSLSDIEAYRDGARIADISYAAYKRAPTAPNELQTAA